MAQAGIQVLPEPPTQVYPESRTGLSELSQEILQVIQGASHNVLPDKGPCQLIGPLGGVAPHSVPTLHDFLFIKKSLKFEEKRKNLSVHQGRYAHILHQCETGLGVATAHVVNKQVKHKRSVGFPLFISPKRPKQ